MQKCSDKVSLLVEILGLISEITNTYSSPGNGD